MVAVAGELMEWDKDYAKELFDDDGFILAAFALSTIGMLILGIIIRMGKNLSQRELNTEEMQVT